MGRLLVASPLLAALSLLAAQTRGRPDLLGEAFQGIAFGDSVAEVVRKLEGQTEELRRFEVEKPYLPLARETQTHLVALGVHTVGVDEVAFTFGDDALVLVEARGGAVDALVPGLEEEAQPCEGFDVYLGALVTAHAERDAVWLLGPEALHPHLFLWENPDLPCVTAPSEPPEPSAARPSALVFGGTLEDLMPRLKAASAFLSREDIAQPWLPTEPRVQTQINCYGVPYAGFPRKIEAVFGDDELQLAWILTGEGEEERLRRALTQAFGPAEFVSEKWEAFDGWRVMLRKDKPEVLMIAERLVPAYEQRIRAEED